MRRVLLTLLLALLAASPAQADTRTEIYRDCLDSQLQGTYTREEIRDALKNMSSDLRTYSDCQDVLERYEFGDQTLEPPPPPAAPGTPGVTRTPRPTPTPPNVPETDADRKAIEDAPAVAQQPVTIDDQTVLAGVSPFEDGRPGNELPAALVVALVLLGIAAVALLTRQLLQRLRP